MQRKKALVEKLFVKFTNMSRIGKQIITIPSGVDVNVNGQHVTVKGPKGVLELDLAQGIGLNIEGTELTTTIANPDDQQLRMLWGTNASLVKNMIIGVSEGFKKELEVNGVGYKVAAQGNKLNLSLGFSHQIDFPLPKGVEAEVDKNKITISGIDKQAVGQVASQIRALRKPEPYKGKGIKYVEEVIRRKAGKAAGSE